METSAMIRLSWRKSRRCGHEGQCVEVAGGGGLVAVRDSAAPADGVLRFRPGAWHRFTAEAKHGRYDLTNR